MSPRRVRRRSFCFNVRASHLFAGDGWKYLHSSLLDKFPTSSIVLTANEERISLSHFKWLSAHFPANRSFYSFESGDVLNDMQSLNLLHHVVECTQSPLWFGDLKQHRKPKDLVPSKVDFTESIDFATDTEDIGGGDEEDRIIYHDGGVLPSEWRVVRVLEKSRAYFSNHRFAVVNRGWVLSKQQVFPPWKLNGRVVITGHTPFHIMFRSPGVCLKGTSGGNVAYGIRASINGKGEFAMETVRMEGPSQRVKSKIDTRNAADSMIDAASLERTKSETDSTLKGYTRISSTGFVLPRSTRAASMHLQAFSFELIDYGAMWPIEFSIQQLHTVNGYPMTRKQTIRLGPVSYPKKDYRQWFHYVVLNSPQNAMWPVLVDRLVVNRENVMVPIRNKHLLFEKKTFKKKDFGGTSQRRTFKNIGNML